MTRRIREIIDGNATLTIDDLENEEYLLFMGVDFSNPIDADIVDPGEYIYLNFGELIMINGEVVLNLTGADFVQN